MTFKRVPNCASSWPTTDFLCSRTMRASARASCGSSACRKKWMPVALLSCSARALRARTPRHHIPGSLHVPYTSLQENMSAGRHAARARQINEQAAPVLLRLRRTLGHGGAGRAGRGAILSLPHPGRHRCLEKGLRPAGSMTPHLQQLAGELTEDDRSRDNNRKWEDERWTYTCRPFPAARCR